MKFLCSLIMCLLFFTISSAANGVITLSCLTDPTSEVSEKVLIEAYKRIGFNLQIRKFPAERALIESNKGTTDGEVNRVQGINKKYVNLIMVPTPVNYFEGMVFTKNLMFPIDGWDSLKPYRTVIRIGSKFAEKGTKDMEVIKVSTYSQAFHLLAIGRSDVCVASRLTGFLQIKNSNSVGIKMIEPPLTKRNLYHYLHKKNKDIIPQINASLFKMQEEGIIEKIRAQYINEIMK